MKNKLVRITTVPISLEKLLENQLLYMSNYYNVIAISSDADGLKKVGEQQKVSTFHLEMTRRITPFKDLKAVFKLYRYLKKEKPQIVHTHTPKAGIIGMLAARMAGVPIRLHTVAGLPLLESKGIKRKILNAVEKLTYACSTNVYPNSFGLKEIIEIEKFTTINKLKVLANGSSNGIDTAYFNKETVSIEERDKLKRNLDISDSDFVFIFVGRIVGDKGINELVQAFEILSKDKEGIKLLLIGPTEEELDPLTNLTISRIKKNKKIIAAGYQDDVRPYFAISNVLVFPSYREGFPNVVMQAGAMELPSIVSDINGCNEIITNNENGIIIPVKNSEVLEKEMLFLIEHPKEYQSMKEKSRDAIVKNYERAKVFEAILSEYKTLV